MKTTLTSSELKQLKRLARIELARRDFWEFLKLMDPKFFKESRTYQKQMAKAYQNFCDNSNKKVLIVNCPPRFGKSYMEQWFCAWEIGRDNNCKIMMSCYNEILASNFGKTIRDKIQEQKEDKDIIVYRDIFPDTFIKKGDGAMNLWGVAHSEVGSNFLCTSPNGSSTGFGCRYLLLDDIIKDYKEACNTKNLDKHWEWVTGTMLSRLEKGGKIICTMTRWSKKDLTQRLIDTYGSDDIEFIILTAMNEQTKEMLCDEILDYESFMSKLFRKDGKRLIPEEVAEANYFQRPIDIKGKLYTSFQTYKKDKAGIYVDSDDKGRPQYVRFKNIISVTDTADEGSDWLCSIVFGEDYKKNAYVLDVYYTKAAAETTIPGLAQFYKDNKVHSVIIESNNGGRLFALAIKKELEEKIKYFPVVKWFHQNKNKEARIISSSLDVMNRIYYPQDWEDRFYEYFTDMNDYQKEGKNEHDDAPDATTMIIEYMDGELITK